MWRHLLLDCGRPVTGSVYALEGWIRCCCDEIDGMCDFVRMAQPDLLMVEELEPMEWVQMKQFGVLKVEELGTNERMEQLDVLIAEVLGKKLGNPALHCCQLSTLGLQ